MKKIYITLCLAWFCACARSQGISLNDLVKYTEYSPAKFENSIAKRGYRMSGFNSGAESRAYTWHAKKAKADTIEKSLFKFDKDGETTIAFQTTSAGEGDALLRQLNKEGYHYVEGAKLELYQKSNITIQPIKQEDGDKTVYRFNIERKELPKASDIHFAEDFLSLTSHEYLATVFGASNVKGDQFYFSEKEINKWSVLFPNTSRQVIFIWNDEENLRDPAFILIGGQLMAQSSIAYSKQIEQNVWQSRQGIYASMSLGELQRLNGSSFNVWGWQSDQPGVVARKNTGAIDFTQLSLVLNCLDCNEGSDVVKNELLNSDNIIRQGRRVYISSIILLPKKK
jgi:hypothetical protein